MIVRIRCSNLLEENQLPTVSWMRMLLNLIAKHERFDLLGEIFWQRLIPVRWRGFILLTGTRAEIARSFSEDLSRDFAFKGARTIVTRKGEPSVL